MTTVMLRGSHRLSHLGFMDEKNHDILSIVQMLQQRWSIVVMIPTPIDELDLTLLAPSLSNLDYLSILFILVFFCLVSSQLSDK